jgi:Alpha 1,4-glycosyltransferase conserved region
MVEDLPLVSLWVDGSLSYIEQVCLLSALNFGHRVQLYTYEEVQNIPQGVEIKDANEILPRQQMIRYRTNGSYALGANIFRYELLRLGLGIWIDTDVYFLNKLEFNDDILFGWEDEKYINNAVLYIPSKSKLIKLLQDFINSNPIVAPWWEPDDRDSQWKLYLNGQHKKLEDLPWATIGPKAITYFAKLLGKASLAKPREVFYPIHWTKAKSLFDSEFCYKDFICENTLTIHTWNHLIVELKQKEPPKDSFIYDICNKYDVSMTLYQ